MTHLFNEGDIVVGYLSAGSAEVYLVIKKYVTRPAGAEVFKARIFYQVLDLNSKCVFHPSMKALEMHFKNIKDINLQDR